MSEDNAKFVFEGGSQIYIPVFKEYLKTFWDIIKEQTNVQSDYSQFRDTGLYERYLLNASQFSAAKSVAVNGMMKTQMFDDKGVRKGFSAFKNDCKAITDVTNDTWLRTEYDTSVRQAVSGQQFISYREDADLYPYWVYIETTSEHPREEHLDLVGNVYRIGDPEGDMVFPPNGFNCFKKGMLVRTKDGNKPIENITKNDFILTRKGYKKVITVINSGFKKVYGIHFDNDIYSHTFYCSLGHEIYTKELGFTAIQDLDLNQEYTLINIENCETKFKISIDEYGHEAETFDLKVSGESEYFVNNILVHNCSCGSEQVDDEYLKENGKSVRTNEESKNDLENGVPEQFRFNPADQGICAKEGHSYFQALPNANDVDGDTFGITGSAKNADKLAARGLHLILKTVDKWKTEYHYDHNSVTFQNEATLSNVVLTNKAILTIEKHSAGFEQLADTVTKPQEIWSTWQNSKEQKQVWRNYIRGNYVVQTEDGVIVNAYLVDNVNRFRKGCIILI